MHITRLFATVLIGGFLAVVPARASFHLWQISEIFSTGDGSIQYIELRNDFDFENFLQGQQLTSSESVFTFPSNLPTFDTGGRNVLIATASFRTLTGLTPDYVIPPNFIFPSGDFVNFASVDSLSFTGDQLPLDGLRSLNGSGGIGLATPTNFAGQTAVVPEPAMAWLLGGCLLMARRRCRGSSGLR